MGWRSSEISWEGGEGARSQGGSHWPAPAPASPTRNGVLVINTVLLFYTTPAIQRRRRNEFLDFTLTFFAAPLDFHPWRPTRCPFTR